MSSEQIIELSVEETNRLRKQLGLPPLRISGTSTSTVTQTSSSSSSLHHHQSHQVAVSKQQEVNRATNGSDTAVLEISVEETNALRAQLGLKPLVETKTKSTVIHKPAENEAEQLLAAERLERIKLQREVQQGIAKFAATAAAASTDSATGADLKSWAAQMRTAKATSRRTSSRSKDSENNKKEVIKDGEMALEQDYTEEQLHGLHVAHSVAELQEGSTTVLTLADTPLLKLQNDTSKKIVGLEEDAVAELENVNLTEAQKQAAGLREKRKVEMGMGRTAGYAGFDDDEFEELGGSQAPSLLARSGVTGITTTAESDAQKKKKKRGFQIGAYLDEKDEAEQEQGVGAKLFAKTISLEPTQVDVTASDFMTVEEDEALRSSKKSKKEPKFKKKKKKDKKHKKEKNKRKNRADDDESDEEMEELPLLKTGKGLLDELEDTAVEHVVTTSARKRRREQDDDDKDGAPNGSVAVEVKGEAKPDKRAKYEAIMEKGNQRTSSMFKPKAPSSSMDDADEEPDDAFLNAALAKARRLNRLKALSSSSQQQVVQRGADFVAEMVRSAAPAVPVTATSGNGGIEFSVDETREFTRALRARTQQIQRVKVKQEQDHKHVIKQEDDIEPMAVEEDIQELAKEVKEDPADHSSFVTALEGTTGTTVPVGRGLGNVLGFLKHSGEMTTRNAGREEMRGRAKDKKTYEDYEPLNLEEVVKIDPKTATEKDKELSQREVKLEYRDKHGRLLTRKEAFRELSYQFHGYGSGKRKEEKRLQQITREQAEARLASRQAADGGTFGALKATQKATGKAFVVHKTQS